jgi:hypothetical protein
VTRSLNTTAWALACRLFCRDGPTLESALSDAERSALATLVDLKAAKPHKLDLCFALCPYCQLMRGPIVQAVAGLICQCPDCGAVPLNQHDTRAWVLDSDWLIRKLRIAFDVPAQQGYVSVINGVWRIGNRQRHPLILARNLDHVLQNLASLLRAGTNGANPTWLITPKPLRDVDADPVAGALVWLPMEERFTLYGGNLQFLEPCATHISQTETSTQAVNGPFSEDFSWVHLDNSPHGLIALSDAQAAVFKALWHYKGQPQSAEVIMNKAGRGSTKPIDVFKVKMQNKGDFKYEGPLQAYKALVTTDRRGGTYAMSCAAAVTA